MVENLRRSSMFVQSSKIFQVFEVFEDLRCLCNLRRSSKSSKSSKIFDVSDIFEVNIPQPVKTHMLIVFGATQSPRILCAEQAEGNQRKPEQTAPEQAEPSRRNHPRKSLAGRGSRCDEAEGDSTAAPEEHGSTAHKQETQARRKTEARQPRKKKNRQQTQAKANRRANPAHIVRCGQKQAGKPEGNELHATVRHRINPVREVHGNDVKDVQGGLGNKSAAGGARK